MKKLITIVCLTLVACAANGQTFLNELRKDVPGEGKVTVVQSAEIDQLVNGKQQEQPATQPQQQQPDEDAQEEHKPDSARRMPIIIGENGEEDLTTPIDTRKKVMRRSYKMQGYRVQVYSGGNSRADRQRAETAGAVMKANFPDQPIYTHFYSPSWKCRMGNYKSQAEAQAYLSRVRKLGYRQACIVKGMIQVQY
ncbi:MAG: SPOR domain-containing protein [Prevotella sp.]|nr:SPOR domain-containing protein [Prevotella sp.]